MLEENKKKIFMIGVIGIVILGGLGYYLIQNKNQEEEFDWEEGFVKSQENIVENVIVEEPKKIIVHISGQVVNPGVITLIDGARIIDAINEAGGVTEEADVSKVNLAYVLEDAQKIYIPSVKEKEMASYILEENGEEFIVTSGVVETKKEETLIININTASVEELQRLPGIGNSIAARIVVYRKENGKFGKIEEIKKVSGIGDSKYSKIKDKICVK